MQNHYLTETNLSNYLEILFKDFEIIRDKQVPNSNVKFRPDYRIEDLKLLIEFDGYGHFTNINTILNDKIKDETFYSLGYTIIRIPYFIQLDKNVLKFLFSPYVNLSENDYINLSSKYKHGFIDDNATLPSCFCYKGVDNFFNFMRKYQSLKLVLADIKNSLENNPKYTQNKLYVVPYNIFINQIEEIINE